MTERHVQVKNLFLVNHSAPVRWAIQCTVVTHHDRRKCGEKPGPEVGSRQRRVPRRNCAALGFATMNPSLACIFHQPPEAPASQPAMRPLIRAVLATTSRARPSATLCHE